MPSYGTNNIVQPLIFSPAVIASSSGTATFTFPQVAVSQVWTGTLACALAPDTGAFTAATGASVFGNWVGSNIFGPVQLGGGDQLTVTATGLVPGVTYQMNFQGDAWTAARGDVPISYPTPYADTVSTSTQQIYLGKKTVSGASQIFTIGTIPYSPLYRSVYMVLSMPTPVSMSTWGFWVTAQDANGNNIGSRWNGTIVNDYPTTAASQTAVVRIPVVNVGQVTLTIFLYPSVSTSGNAVTVFYGADLATTETAVWGSGPVSTIPVATYTQNQLPIGGRSIATGTIAGSGSGTLLPALPTGSSYRLHSIYKSVATYAAGTGLILTPGGAFAIGLIDTGSATTPIINYQMFLNGLLVDGPNALTAVNTNTSTLTWYLTYDVISTPVIS